MLWSGKQIVHVLSYLTLVACQCLSSCLKVAFNSAVVQLKNTQPAFNMYGIYTYVPICTEVKHWSTCQYHITELSLGRKSCHEIWRCFNFECIYLYLETLTFLSLQERSADIKHQFTAKLCTTQQVKTAAWSGCGQITLTMCCHQGYLNWRCGVWKT